MPPTPDHLRALAWFGDHASAELRWRDLELDDGTRLVTAAKGIYKPAGSPYALSVSQRIGSTYSDEPLAATEGSWAYRYHQEGPTTTTVPHPTYTNAALNQCMQDNVLVGVLVQVSDSPVRYRILGLARVATWAGGFYRLEGTDDESEIQHAEPETPWLPPVEDSRERARAFVVRRYGQPAFRRRLLEAYQGRCAVTEADAVQVLEAAHISPYVGPESDTLRNGLLLRSDVHALFDIGLVAIDGRGRCVLIADELLGTTYAPLQGSRVRFPTDPTDQPSLGALDAHREWTGL